LGYLEFEATKRLQSDRSWVGKAVGKSLKVIAHMVPFLPANFTYKIICLHRDLDEVIASQSKMLLRNGEAGADLSDASLKACFQKQMEQLERFFAKAPHIEMLRLCYNDVLKDPVLSTNEIGDFLNRQLQLQPMVEVVRPELYRSRSGHLSDGPSQNT